MRRLAISVDASEQTCGNCERLHVPEELDRSFRGTCELFGAGMIRTREGQFNRLVACLNAERIAAPEPPEAA